MSTTIALRHERRKKSITIPVNAMPSPIDLYTLSSCCCVKSACTLSTVKTTCGYFLRIAGSAARKLSEAVISLAPVAFCACSVIAGTPPTYPNCRRRSLPV